MNFEKLKETARKYEQKEEWRRAIEVYLQAIREFEAGNDPVPDLSVYNRIGDLYLKATEPALAVQAYERAADLYGEQGFYNNAIALCGKILRVNPGRIQTYLKLAHLHARKNVVIEAKKNLLEYLERMNAMNQLDDAFKALKDFADQFPGNKDIRLMLSELLRASSRNAEAKEQLEKLANDLEARGDTVGARKTLMRLQALESGEAGGATPSPDAPRGPQVAPRRGGGDLIFLDTGADLPRFGGSKSAPPVTRKTRAVTAPHEAHELAALVPPAATAEPEALLEPIAPGADLPPAVIDDSPLQIETASLADTPLELESLQPISDEALVELSDASDVPQALGFEPTELETGAGASVAPLEGLELDAPASDSVDLQVSTEGLDIERASLDPEELEAGERSSLIIPEPVDAPEAMGDLEPMLSAEEVTGDVELIDADTGEVEPLPAEPEFISLATDNVDDLGLLEPPIDEPVAADLLIDEAMAPEEAAVEFVSIDDEEGIAVVPEEELPLAEAMPRLSAPDVSIEEPAPLTGPSISDLEDRVLDDPDDPETHRALGEALLAEGDQIRGQEELELALAGYEQREDWQHAGDLINELIRLDPNGVRYHQKRVEIGFRSGDRSRLIDSYLELADALLRVGAMDKALAVYRRVAEHDPGNQRAHAALDALSGSDDDMPMIPLPPAAERPRSSTPAVDDRSRHKSAPVTKVRDEPAGGDFIDLGALVMDDEAVKDTRMRVDDEGQTGDEQKDFQDMLSAFKRGIDENIDAEDYQAHYDLGVAFKEMGLLDEAIAEFQKALRAPEGRLKTSEALGTAFYEKGQFAIAEAILKRAVESLGATDDEQIGLIYWLGRAQAEQNKVDAAISNFERILAVDIGFADVSARIGRLAAGRGK